ncbi:deoxynucleoside triphosphate triphosphohydrolase SAMHD1-like [Labrus mixtus]|uniref:deoxynucleoside triphosphate triphosphohydrolase SAMHD1-like n=1 Tax=Labrus mixtus TaxID=508554 RepID=UPI0029C0C365|nr:deoxynucleoside triphosphate triphosphohydrolase SAMHD1-like [Labrus mixtus]
MELHPLLIKIIDTPQFQRLRFIKQLGGVYFVYPGASHNRFEHSIGVGYLAGKLAEDLRSRQPELKISDEDVLCVQIAGLCHDLGHGPFSHLYDGMFLPKALEKKEEMRRNGELGEEEKLEEWKHEKGSCDMLDHLVKENNIKPAMDMYGLIPEKDIRFIKEMIAGPLQESKSKKWPYKGRPEEKSFLYEIVSNKKNGVDVDKFDYLARIAEAFLKADGHIEIEGSGGRMFTLSTAFKNMEAYTKLTDNVFEEILNSSRPELQESRQILQNIISRKIYKFVGERKPEDPIEDWKSQKSVWKEELAQPLPDEEEINLTPEDFEILVINMDYGMKEEDPVEYMHFYSKYEPDVAKSMSIENASRIGTKKVSEQLIKVFCKKIDEQSVEAAKKHFEQWVKTKPNLFGSEGNLSDPPAVDTKEITKQHE